MEIRRQTAAGMERSPQVIREAYAKFARSSAAITGTRSSKVHDRRRRRGAGGDGHLVESGAGRHPRDAKGSKKVGFVRVRWFRPFAAEELAQSLSRFKAVGIIDRDFSLGAPYSSGVLATEVRAALLPGPQPAAADRLHLRPGRPRGDAARREEMTENVYAAAAGKPQPSTQWIGLRE